MNNRKTSLFAIEPSNPFPSNHNLFCVRQSLCIPHSNEWTDKRVGTISECHLAHLNFVKELLYIQTQCMCPVFHKDLVIFLRCTWYSRISYIKNLMSVQLVAALVKWRMCCRANCRYGVEPAETPGTQHNSQAVGILSELAGAGAQAPLNCVFLVW